MTYSEWARHKLGPCIKSCPDRHPGCHDNCSRYQEWKAERDRLKKQRSIYRKQESYHFSFYERSHKEER